MPSNSALAVSVITAAHNAEGFLGNAFDSLLAQSFQDFEWVVTDDGSSDATFTLLSEYAREAPFPVTVLRHETSEGPAAARNRALAVSNGAFVKVLDADDSLPPNHLEAQLQVALAHPGCTAVSPVEYVLQRPGRPAAVVDGAFGPVEDIGALLGQLIASEPLSHCGCLFPRDHLTVIGGYDAELATDEDGWLLLCHALEGLPFAPASSTRYSYRVNVVSTQTNLAGDESPRALDSRYEVCQRIRKRLRADGTLTHYAEALAQRLDALAMRAVVTSPTRAQKYLEEARALCPGYAKSGNATYRALRAVLPALWARRSYDTLRSLRTRMIN